MPIPDKPSYSHGSTGTEPASKDYADGDPLDADNLDHFVYTPFKKIKEIIDALNEIKNGTITVGQAASASSADSATNVKGNDIDSDGDGKVDSADSADIADTATKVKGNDIDSDGDGQVDSADSADTATKVKGNDIDSDGDGIVNNADAVNGITIYVQPTEPTGAETKDIWIDTSE